jgi:L-ascorbate metabolism protein UlaG (beta-lactamase superfamily)
MALFNLVANLTLVPMIFAAASPASFETDTVATSAGELKITFIGHGTLLFRFGGKTVHVDPVGQYADYARLPKADVILVTHEHFDHLDKQAIAAIAVPETLLVVPAECARQLGRGVVMKNGDVKTFQGLKVEAVPAYNVVHERAPGQPFHPKGAGNGYVITFADQRVYVAGDTENVPEMAKLAKIDIAFLPMNLPYTMTPEMVAQAVRAIQPRIVYPYHFGKTDTRQLVRLLSDLNNVEVRIRKLQ